MRYGSVCSGIEAATTAWHPLGWHPVFFSEIEKFPCEVLRQRYPDTPNLGDMTKFKEWPIREGDIDLLVGGTPCQSFSVAGLRAGLDDPRGNLALVFAALLARLKPRWFVWENVPGVFSAEKGTAFGSILGAFQELGYGCAFRTLDAQYFGVPQRRRRVFVVGHLGDWRRAVAALLEPESLRGDPPPSRKKKEDVAPSLAARTRGGGGLGTDHDLDGGLIPMIANPLMARAVAFDMRGREGGAQMEGPHDTANIRAASGGSSRSYVVAQSGVRRLTPKECARLQGFPDDYLDISFRGKPATDGPKYKAYGNSMAVPVMRWIGERIQMVEDLTNELHFVEGSGT
jgi:DNA (cytosine-5)-methyltransferase 1